ncbi:hypothetical protein BDZ45DRAFT_20275 [Acephala macrosclerotiorum]|nr:hypothetical protein BDZ45DRAFT_20275 [Acephala macrosclerotiorum]
MKECLPSPDIELCCQTPITPLRNPRLPNQHCHVCDGKLPLVSSLRTLGLTTMAMTMAFASAAVSMAAIGAAVARGSE